MVLEQAIIQIFDLGSAGNEQVRCDAGVGIPDVFRGEWQQDFFEGAIGLWAAEHVEQVEKGGLTAVGEGDVLRADVPAKRAVQKLGQGGDEGNVPLRRRIIPNRSLEPPLVQQKIVHLLTQSRLHFRDVGGVAAAQHHHLTVAG